MLLSMISIHSNMIIHCIVEENIFSRYCLHAFITGEILQRHINDCFETNGKQRIRCKRKVNMLKSNILKEKKSPFMIYADFENNLVPGDNGKQNTNESYTNEYKKQIICIYDYILVYDNHKFSKLFKSNLGEDVVYNFISSIIEESKYCNNLMKKHFNKELVMTKKDN